MHEYDQGTVFKQHGVLTPAQNTFKKVVINIRGNICRHSLEATS